MTTTQLVIGHNEYISFPVYGVSNPVPAKVDTGADGCAIWASTVNEDESGLHFTLFDNGSVFFTNQLISTQEYKTKRIKNSFGITEVRYSVKLSFTLGKKRYKNWFSLANRSNNHFPILLGRKFLKNRFLVDVSRHHLLSNEIAPAKVLVLAKYATAKTRAFYQAIEADSKAQYTVTNYNDLVFSTVGPLKVTIGIGGTDIADHKLVYFKSHVANAELASALAIYLDYRNVVYRDTELARAVSQGKLTESVLLKAHNICSPPMLAMKQSLMLQSYKYVVTALGSPFVLKDTMANRGKDNYLISNKHDFETALQNSNDRAFFMAQEYIPNNGYMRAMVLGNQDPLIISRVATPHHNPLKAHLNKPAGGDNASLIDANQADPVMIDLARRAARVLDRQIAGVDLIEHNKTGEWFVLEVNNNPQIMTGSFVPEKAKAFAKYIRIELDRW